MSCHTHFLFSLDEWGTLNRKVGIFSLALVIYVVGCLFLVLKGSEIDVDV